MNYTHIKPFPIKICLQDSIFKQKNHQNSFQQREFHGNQKQFEDFIEPISSFNFLPEEPLKIVEYLNAQYYGFIQDKKPQGTGIVIDDELNFFLSSWNNMKMNKLSFVKLLNETMLYGTWINGKMHGWNCFKIGKFEIFLEIKYHDNFAKDQPIFNIGVVIDRISNLCYIFEIESQKQDFYPSKSNLRVKIINRKKIPLALKKEFNQNISVLMNELFPQIHIKIPQYLSSLQIFLSHLSFNNPDVVFKEILDQNERHFFLSIQNSLKQNQSRLKFKSFNPYREIFVKKTNSNELQIKQSTLGLLFREKIYKTKSIGYFDSKYELNGIGMTYIQNNTKLFGQFKANLLTKELNQSEHQKVHSNFFTNQNIKKKLGKYHQKSFHFIQDILYFENINSAIQITKRIIQFVDAFENEFVRRYSKELDSFSLSEQSFEAKYEVRNQEKTMENRFSKKQLNQDIQTRPYGRIVNSRSPLRSLTKSHSKSTSDIQTFRQRRPLEFHYVDDSPNNIDPDKSKNSKNLTIHTHSALNSKFNQETSKNRSYADSMGSSISYKETIQAKMRQAQIEDIVETVRRRNEFSQRRSQQRRNQLNVGYKCRYDRLQKRRQAFWK